MARRSTEHWQGPDPALEAARSALIEGIVGQSYSAIAIHNLKPVHDPLVGFAIVDIDEYRKANRDYETLMLEIGERVADRLIWQGVHLTPTFLDLRARAAQLRAELERSKD